MARDDATFIRYLPFMVKLIPYMFQDGSLSLPNLTLCFAICVLCIYANSSKVCRYLGGNGA